MSYLHFPLHFVNDVTNISIPLCIASKAITLPATELPWKAVYPIVHIKWVVIKLESFV